VAVLYFTRKSDKWTDEERARQILSIKEEKERKYKDERKRGEIMLLVIFQTSNKKLSMSFRGIGSTRWNR